jgi:penicillin amidase
LRRRLGVALGLVMAVPASAALAAWLLLRGSLPQLDGERASGPGGPVAAVTLERDAAGVTTVSGRSLDDVAWGLGFAHAQDRYFQMDLARRLAAGELAALVGAAAVPQDRRARPFRFRAVARRVLAEASDAERSWLEAYAGGVNAGLDALGVRPWEYLLLRTAPQPWRPEDSVLVLHSMWWQLQHGDLERDAMRRAVLEDVLPRFPQALALLYPNRSEWDAPNPGVGAALAAAGGAGPSAIRPALPPPELLDLRRTPPRPVRAAATGWPSAAGDADPRAKPGSNAWVVAGARAAGGAALVANDMHLGLGVPAVWYRAELRVADPQPGAAQRRYAGITLPGLPVLVAGSNGEVAWGFTNSYGDWVDVEALPCDPAARTYQRAGARRAFARTMERIEVLRGEPVLVEVLDSPDGVRVDLPVGEGRCALARWLAVEPGATTLAARAFMQSRSVAEAVALAPRVGMPQQNLMVGDRAGRIAWTIIGRVPRGDAGPQTPRPVTWRDASEQPSIVDPPVGALWTANSRAVGGEAERVIGGDEAAGGMAYDLGARASQIRDALLALPPGTTPADMLSIQLDDRARLLERWHALLLGLLDDATVAGDPRRAALRAALSRWEGRAAVDSVSYRLVREFREEVRLATWRMLLGGLGAGDAALASLPVDLFEQTLWQLVSTRPPHLLAADAGDWRAFLLRSVDATLERLAADCPALADCRWGARNTLAVVHPLSRSLGPLSSWLDMPPLEAAGDQDMPRVQGRRFGASERFAVAPGRESEGYLQLPGGASGHPLSPFYRAGYADWAAGRAVPFLAGPARHRLSIRPRPDEAT